MPLRTLAALAAPMAVLLALAAGPLPAADSGTAELLRQGREAYNAGKWDDALGFYDKAIAAAPTDANPHAGRGHVLLAKKDFPGAIRSFTRVVEIAPNHAGAYQWRGETYFRAAKMKEAIADFDQFLRLSPGREAHHWQRGIACYYAGRFADGKRQFEIHQGVNSQDVENAVWHFLCNARLNGVAQARKELIPISGDTRVPMKQVHDLFAGKGSMAQVLDAAGTGAERRGPRFYAHLYLGLYFEATGDAKQAREHIEKAAKDFAEPHYMGDVARVHLQLMNQPAGK